jgi:PAS domain S-box-containing protein
MSTRAKILVVDDRPENLLAVEAILGPLGHELVRAESGPEALRALLRDEFAVILLDVQMPGMNGFETVEIIKSRERSRDIPIIFLTAISKEDEYVFRGYEVGAVDYMFKPLNPDILRSKVSVFVDLYLKNRQLREQERRLHEVRERELHQQHQLERVETDARFGAVIASATEAIITFDEHNRITLFNEAAEDTFGRRQEDVVDTSVLELLQPGERTAFARLAANAAAPDIGHTHSRVVFKCRRPNGSELPFECSISHLQLREGGLFTLIGRDISQRMKTEQALERQAEQLSQLMEELRTSNEELMQRQHALEEAIGARSRFYTSMSHELRTPINAILGYTSLLLDGVYGEVPEKQVRGVERTHRAATHLLELVNDILDLSKIESGKFELAAEPVHIPALVEDLFVTVRPLAEQQGSTLTLNHDGEPVTITSDSRRVRQILLNLLSNAIKFGRGEPIAVLSEGLPNGGVRVSVQDHGAGIAAEDQRRIFEEFVQLGGNPEQEGTGLGLPISRRLAKLLDGCLEVTSEVGKGSTFTLELPPEISPLGAISTSHLSDAVRAWTDGSSTAVSG